MLPLPVNTGSTSDGLPGVQLHDQSALQVIDRKELVLRAGDRCAMAARKTWVPGRLAEAHFKREHAVTQKARLVEQSVQQFGQGLVAHFFFPLVILSATIAAAAPLGAL